MKTIPLILLLVFGTSLTTRADDDVIPSAEAIVASTPLALTATTTKLADQEIKVTPLKLPQPILTSTGFKNVTSASIAGDKLYLMIGMGKAVAYQLPAAGATDLVLDTNFGTNGELKIDNMHAQGISANTQGDVFAQSGWSTMRYRQGAAPEKIDQGSIYWRPGKNYGFIVGNNKLTLYANGQSQDKSLPAEGTGQVGSAGWVPGGFAYRMKEEGTKDFLRVIDAKGNKRFDLGNKEDAFEPDGFCWVHAVTSTEHVIAVADSNCRKIVFFKANGSYIGTLKAKSLGLDYPWMPALAFAPDGTLYLAGEQRRKIKTKDEVREAFVLRIEGINVIK